MDAVTDFIDPPLWPTFNLADIAITLGALGAGAGLAEPGSADDAAERRGAEAGVGVSAEPRIVHVDEWLAVSTSPPASSSTPRPGTAGPRSSTRSASCSAAGTIRSARGSSTGSTRTPPGLMIVARGDEAHRLPRRADQGARGQAHLPRAGGGAAALAHRGRSMLPLGRDYRAPERRAVGGRGPREARTHFTRRGDRFRRTRWSRRAWRPAAPIRSAPTSRRSGTRSPGTLDTGMPAATASSASSCTARGWGSGIR